MRILITGGTGFIGTNFLQKLSKNFEIIVLTHSENNSLNNFYKENNIVTELHDIQNKKIIDKIEYYKPEVVIHLANLGNMRECENNKEKAFNVNVNGTFNVLKACEKINSKIIFSSSREVYGETTNIESFETDLLHPNNVLGMTKMLSEDLIQLASGESDLNYTILRLTNVFGPHAINSGVARMINYAEKQNKIQIFGGKQSLNLIYIDDVIEIINLILKNEKASSKQIFNVGSDYNIKVKELAHKITKLFNKDIDIEHKEPRKGETSYFKPNIKKLKDVLGFESKKTIDEGLKDTFDWMFSPK